MEIDRSASSKFKIYICPKCKACYLQKQEGNIWKCKNSNCNAAFKLSNLTTFQELPTKDQLLQTQYKCPKCQTGNLRKIRGKNEVFWGCDNYPKCTVTYNDMNGIPVLDKMPPQKYPIWVRASFNCRGDYYHYLSGDISDLKVGDKVVVYIRGSRRKKATICYISSPTELPPIKIKTPILLKIRGRYMASRYGQKYHDPSCVEMNDVKDNEAIWFQTAEQAQREGYQPCRKCKP